MTSTIRAYDALIRSLAAAGSASLGLLTLLVAYDVLSRNLPWFPAAQWTSATAEYALLFSTMAASPWMIRIGGHVAITAFVDGLPAGARRRTGQAMLVVSIVTLLVLAWTAGSMSSQQYSSGARDIRSIAIPGWILYSFLATGLTLMATEFLRLLLRGDIYSGEGGTH